jgi:hypothetical protein
MVWMFFRPRLGSSDSAFIPIIYSNTLLYFSFQVNTTRKN